MLQGLQIKTTRMDKHLAFILNKQGQGNMTPTCNLMIATMSTFQLCYGILSTFGLFIFIVVQKERNYKNVMDPT